MAKVKKDNPIALEASKYSKKIKEYQDYLEKNNILLLGEEDDKYKEIAAQNSIMNLLPAWLSALKTLLESEEKKVEGRGGTEVPKLMQS